METPIKMDDLGCYPYFGKPLLDLLAWADFAGRRQALGYVRPSSVAT